jgi:hypothetical protein
VGPGVPALRWGRREIEFRARVTVRVCCSAGAVPAVASFVALCHSPIPLNTARSDDIARAAWLLTAPLLMPMVAAIWASDRSP